MKTIMSTDWIEIHDHGSVYMTRIFLTDQDRVYMIKKTEEKMNLFRVDKELLNLGELGFFEKVMESAIELRIEHAFEIGLIDP